jgi:hypothetical protein
LAYDGYVLPFVEWGELPVEEVDDTSLDFGTIKVYVARLGMADVGGVLPAKEGALAVVDVGGEEGIRALTLSTLA